MARNLRRKSNQISYAHFDINTGISIVQLRTPYGIFEGIAELHPYDADVSSNYMGCRVAELRAYIKYFKYIVKKKKENLHFIIAFDNHFKTKAIQPYIKKQTDSLKTSIHEYRRAIEELSKEIQTEIECHDITIDKIRKMQKDKKA